MKKAARLIPSGIRIWHWSHAVAILLLMVSGMQIRFTEYISIFPFGFAVKLHRTLGWFLLADFVLWMIYIIATRSLGRYLPHWGELRQSGPAQLTYYLLGIFRGDSNPFTLSPENPLNPLQKIIYGLIMGVCVPLQILTGIILWKGTQSQRIIDVVETLKTTDAIHVSLFFLLTAFLIGHLYLGTTGKTPAADFRAMFTGDEPLGKDESL